MIYITVFGDITMTKNLISYNSFIDYKNLANYTNLMI